MKICIDAGHGGKWNNATAYDGTLEKNENLTNALLLRDKFEARGHTVFMTRVTDTQLSTNLSTDLNARANLANENDCDCFISCHENGYPDADANGYETVIGSNASKTSNYWANLVSDKITASIPIKRRTTLTQSLTVLTKTKMPAILLEYGFMTNEKDMNTIRNYRNQYADIILECTESIFGTAQPSPTPTPDKNYYLGDNAQLWRDVGIGEKGLKIELDAYPVQGDTGGDYARIRDTEGNKYLCRWDAIEYK